MRGDDKKNSPLPPSWPELTISCLFCGGRAELKGR